jgi:putative heme iron utilization protein
MSFSFNTEVSERICKHMNEDHGDAVLLYAQNFSNITDSTTASMLSIDSEGMNLKVNVSNGASEEVRILFDHILVDSEDAHQTLIAMVRQARLSK